MSINDRRFVWTYLVLCAAVTTVTGTTATADVGPPVAIKLLRGDVAAAAGADYSGTFEIRVYKPGELSEIKIDGEGWTVVTSTAPAGSVRADVETLRVDFTARPLDADEPLGLSMRYNGRWMRTAYDVGPARSAQTAERSLELVHPDSPALDLRQPYVPEVPDSPDPRAAAGGAVPIRVVGRIKYLRAGVDRSDPPDGDFGDPEDTPEEAVGGDHVAVRLLDQDVIDFEVIWDGFTDSQGYFDSGVVMWDDCDATGCDVPDLRLLVGVGSSQFVVTNLDDEVYRFMLPEIENFTGDFHDYSDIFPAQSTWPAYHIWSNLVRAARFVEQEAAAPATGVGVYWPDDSEGDGAWYTAGDQRIHISTEREWRSDTVIHEYGHHHNHVYYTTDPPAPNYCDADADCDPNPPTSCGHCMWCDENQTIAWFEGWCNWLADVVTRDYPNRYQFDDGRPYEALYTRSQEHPDTCNGIYDARLSTEGFVGALLRDIEDSTQDDHDDDPDPEVTLHDGIFDQMCLWVEEIFYVTYNTQPTTVTEFISGFISTYDPLNTAELWPTAYNVGGSAYVSAFPPDMLPPGVVGYMDSSTHPLGVGGSLPCITFEFNPAPDDVTGTSVYSYVLTSNVNGEEPNEVPNAVRPTDSCMLQGTLPAWDIGNWYVSIKAQDNAGHWSNEYATFGPFEVLDCNFTGQLDMCDISCTAAGIPGVCDFGISPCNNLPECVETSQDCNGNVIPDECDVASGVSEDCDLNIVPDECQAMKHWSPCDLQDAICFDWGEDFNWAESAIPELYDVACLSADSGGSVFYKEAHAHLASLACWFDFIIDGPATIWPEWLELDVDSFIFGDFTMKGDSKLTVYDRLFVGDYFNWHDGTIDGGGLVEVDKGLRLWWDSVDLVGSELKLLSGESYSDGPMVNMSGGAALTIRPAATYLYQGDSYAFYGSNGVVNVEGTFARTTGLDTATIYTPVDNSGMIHVQTGELVLGRGGTHAGALLGDPGTTLALDGEHELLPGSSVAAETLVLGSSNGGHIRGTVDISDTLSCERGIWTFHPEADIISYGPHLIATHGTHRFEAPTDAPVDFDTVTIGPPSEGSLSVYFDTGEPVNVTDFDLNKGGVYGSSPINIYGALTWDTQGFRSGGAVTAYADVTLENPSSTYKWLDRTFNNTQTTTMFGGGLAMGGPGSVRWYNLPGSMFLIQADSVSISGRTFENAGTVLRSSGTGVATISSFVENAGLIRNQTGTMRLSGGGMYTGELRSDPGTVLELGGNLHDFQTTSTVVAETLLLSAANSELHGNVDVSDALVCDGCSWTFASDATVISYSGDLTVRPGSLHVEAPTDRAISFDTVTLGPDFYGSNVYFDTGQPVTIGTLTMDDNATLFGSSPIQVDTSFVWKFGNIFQGGDLTLTGDTAVHYTSSARTCYRHINNEGNLTLLGGGFTMGSSRVIHNLPTGAFDLAGNSTRLSSSTFDNAGLLVRSAGTGAHVFNGMDVLNSGTVDIQADSIEMQGAEYIQSAGRTVLSGGDLAMTFTSPPVAINGGSLEGVGTVLGGVVNSGGTTAPGLSAGVLTVDGDYTQGAGGALTVELGGLAQGVEYDLLAVTGAASLAGRLEVVLIDSFVPMVGDTFEIVTAAAVSGTFDPVVRTAFPDDLGVRVTYSADAVFVEIVERVPGICDLGAGVDPLDYTCFNACMAGPNANVVPECDVFDYDGDQDVDMPDFAAFERARGATP